MDYTALQVKTSYSILESLNNISQLVSKASNLGYTSLAITDKNNMFGVMEFYLECKKNNIKPIIGMEIFLEEIKVLLYSKNEIGYKKLIKIATKISEESLELDDIYDDNLILVMPYKYFDAKIFNSFSDKYIGYSNKEERTSINNNYKCVYINDVSYLEKEDYKYLDYLYMIKEAKVIGEYELYTNKGKHLLNYEEIK